MDWDLKVPASWDLADLEHHHAAAPPAPAAAAGPSSGHVNAGGGGRGECSVDLKLGGLGECELGGHAGADRRGSREAGKAPAPALGGAASNNSNKRPRAADLSKCPSCAVDGCKADLSKCRDYHRRHKVCEAHSKTPVVVVAGREMRFCQQCSRFHLLAEFDETKRSCRKRLDGHNRRRRKPQPDPMTSASFITSQLGTRFSPFTSARPEAHWSGIIKTEESPYYGHQIPLGSSNRQHFVGSTSAYSKDGRRFPFLQEGEINFATGVVLEASAVCQPLLKTVAALPESGGCGGSKMFSDGLTRVLDSDCALSLLSAPANSSGIDVGRMVRPAEHVPLAQPLVSGLQFGSASSWFSRPHAATAGAVSTTTTATGMENDQQHPQLHTVLGSNDSEMNYNGMFHVGGDGSSDGTSSSLPFSWQ